MTNQLLSDLDLEELKRFPVLCESWQRFEREAKAEGARTMAREYILDAIVTRFNPPAMEYRKVEKAVASVDDLERLNALFRRALVAEDFAAFARELATVE